MLRFAFDSKSETETETGGGETGESSGGALASGGSSTMHIGGAHSCGLRKLV